MTQLKITPLIGAFVLGFTVLALSAIPAFAQDAKETEETNESDAKPNPTLPSYRLNPGDTLEVAVWKDDSLSRKVVVLPDGNISFPLAGTIVTAGKTVAEIQDLVVEGLSKFINNPVVTITVESVGGNRIYVIGKVKTPGTFAMSGNVDVMQALSLAGGLTRFADSDEIRILRRSQDGQAALPFDYSSVSKGQKLETNIVLKSGDIVVVP